MKSILSKLKAGLIPLILCVAILSTALMSIYSMSSLEGEARVINYTGIVRGATQRLIKKELNHEPDDALILHLDNILDGLVNGSEELNLVKLEDQEFQVLLLEMKDEWSVIKKEIYHFRDGNASDTLYALSEDYFNLADQTTLAAEVYTDEMVQNARNIMFYMNVIFIIMAIGCAIFSFYQEKRRKKLVAAEDRNRIKSQQLAKRSQELLVPMNEISELIYVSDVDTYELLFINEAGKKTFNVKDGEKHLCYKVLQGFDKPCSFCTTSVLKKDETYSWEYRNPLTKHDYLLKDRLMEWDGRPARMEIAFDISDTVQERRELQTRINRDNRLIQCIRELYYNDNIIESLTNTLREVGQLFDADRAYIFILHEDKLSNTSEWCKEGIIPQIDNLQNLNQSDYLVWFDMFKKQESIVIKDIEDIKLTMQVGYDLLQQQGIKNVIMVPLYRDNHLNGIIGLDNLSVKLMESAATFLETLQYYIMLAMRRDEDKKQLYSLSYHDKLTSFYNRNRYTQDVNHLLNKHDSVGIVYLDVNGLKEVNDNYGHDAGDKLLNQCAKVIQSSFTVGSFYRIGGDEFVIICTNISKAEFNDTVQKLKNNFLDENCKVAIGSKWEEDCKNIQTAIKTADSLMYTDKKGYYQRHRETGRYRHNNEVLELLANPDLLNDKIANEQFKVYLQAKINVETHELVGAEALVRYMDDSGDIQAPDKFISVLENANQISKVDFYVFEKVCAQLQQWQEQDKKLFPISSNFSRYTFLEENFIERLETIVNRYNISKEYIEIEITESMCSTNFMVIKDCINQIRDAGFRVSVDDFGTESSNLALLAMAKFDVLKIDKGFVEDIITNEHAQTIVEAMVGVCKKINIQLIAEGVENESQLDVLKRCGVKTVQGFLFSRPIPMIEYEWKYLNR